MQIVLASLYRLLSCVLIQNEAEWTAASVFSTHRLSSSCAMNFGFRRLLTLFSPSNRMTLCVIVH